MTDVSQGESPSPGVDRSRRHSSLVAAGIFLSRISGFVRERAIGHFLGLSFAANAFAAAFKIPNLMQNLLGEGVLSASFIPVYARLLDEDRHEEAGRVAGAIAGLLFVAAGALALVAVVAARPVLRLLTPGLEGRELDLAASLMPIIAPGIAVLVLSAWCLGILNSHRRFFLSYVVPVLWNLAQVVAIIGAGVFLLDDVGDPSGATPRTLAALTRALAWGTLAGGVLQFAVQLPAVLRLTRGLRPSLDTSLPGVRQTIRAFGPVVTGRGVIQLLTFVDVFLASLLAGAAIAALAKAQMLYLLPISLFGMSVAAAELPAMSTASLQEREALATRLDAGLERVAFYVVPTVIGFVLLGDVLVGALFQTGAFGRGDVLTVWIILLGFCVGLVASTSSRLLQSAFYGGGDTRTPAKLAVLRVVLSASLGAILMLQFDRVVIDDGLRLLEGASLPAFRPLPEAVRTAPAFPHLGAAGLSLATGISAWLEYQLLRRRLTRRLGRAVSAGGAGMSRILVAAVPATIVALALRLVVTDLHPILGAAVAVPAVAGVYLAAAWRLRLHEARGLLRQVGRRVRR